VFNEVLEDPKYKSNMMKLKTFSMTSGGKDLAVQTIEREYIH
jgi:hypothetical protein